MVVKWRQCYVKVTTSCEPRHEISNNVVCATSKGSAQPAHTRSLIRTCASRLGILGLLSYWPKLKRRLHRLIWVYTCQNATLLEIKYHGSCIIASQHNQELPKVYFKTKMWNTVVSKKKDPLFVWWFDRKTICPLVSSFVIIWQVSWCQMVILWTDFSISPSQSWWVLLESIKLQMLDSN